MPTVTTISEKSSSLPIKDIGESLRALSKHRGTVVVFVGNGLNEGVTALSTKSIVSGFVKGSASANPREFEERKKVIK